MSSNLIVNNIEVGAGATIYTAASNQLTFGTNGSEKVRITSDGKVGISEDDPQAQLHINSGANSAIMFGNTTNGYKIRANVTSSHDYGLLIEDEDGVDLYRVTSSTGTTNANTHRFFTAGDERLHIASDGDVIIGGTDAGYPNFADNLTIHDTQHSGITIRSGIASQGAVYFSDATGSGAGTYVGNIIYDHSDNHMRFATSGTERLRIDTNGKVGIGTDVPDYGLHVYGAGDILIEDSGNGSAHLRLRSANGGSDVSNWKLKTSSNNYFYIENDTVGGASQFTIDSSGDVDVRGNIKSNNLPGRNLLINGAMRVNQKGNLTHNSDGYQVADMWWWGKYSTDQLVTTQANVTNDHPDEFDHSYKLTVATAETTLDSNEYGILRTRIEGQNLQHLKTGTASAKELTLSFWAKTGSANSGDTYSICIIMGDISGDDRIQYRTFTPTSTWQRFTMSFVGQTNNQIRNDHDYGITIHYVLAAGSSKVTSANTTWSLNTGTKGVTGQSNFFDNTSNEFYVTGVQLEVGSIATEFEHRSYGEELALCQRYYYMAAKGASKALGLGVNYTASEMHLAITFPVTMRTTPTLDAASGNAYYEFIRNGAADWFNSFNLGNRTTNKIGELYNNSEISGSGLVGYGGFVRTDDANVHVGFNCEL